MHNQHIDFLSKHNNIVTVNQLNKQKPNSQFAVFSFVCKKMKTGDDSNGTEKIRLQWKLVADLKL